MNPLLMGNVFKPLHLLKLREVKEVKLPNASGIFFNPPHAPMPSVVHLSKRDVQNTMGTRGTPE
jgi:hypothetical protein